MGLVLGVLGATLRVGGLRRVAYAHSHEHRHGGETHSHAHAHLPLFGDSGHGHDDGEHPDSSHDDGEHHHTNGDQADGDHDSDGSGDDPAHTHDHTVRACLRTGLVGALFTLSPPLSMLAFSATLFPAGPELVAVAVGADAVAITATMSTLGAGVGAVFGTASELNVRVYGGAQALADWSSLVWRSRCWSADRSRPAS